VAALTILALLVPLSNAFVKLSEEVSQKRQQNSLRRVATNLWQDQFSNEPDNQPRSSIERIIITEQDQSVKVKLNVFTSRLYSPIEKEKYTQELAKKLNKNPQQVQLFLTEIPTASNELLAKKEEVPVPAELKPPNFGDLKLNLVQSLNTAIADLSLPPTVQMLDYSLTTGKSGDTLIAIAYLGENPLSEDAQTLVAQDVRRRIGITQANVSLDYINPLMGEISFDDNAAVIPLTANDSLDAIGKLLKRYPNLDLSISISLRSLEPSSLTQSRLKAIASYLESNWQVEPERLRLSLLSNIGAYSNTSPLAVFPV
jgi:hypothetical protein